MALARQLAQYDYEQRRKQHQSILDQQHIRNGQILHALEQNLAVIDAKARELRSKGIRDKELDVLLTEARWKRDQARAAALAGLEEHGRALDDPCHADQQQPPLDTTSMSIQPSPLVPLLTMLTASIQISWQGMLGYPKSQSQSHYNNSSSSTRMA